jgi:nucleoside-triphosphatase THEP1
MENIARNSILITAKPHSGKTTFIKRMINVVGPEFCGGFYTQEISSSTQGSRERIGFEILTLSGLQVPFASLSSPSTIKFGRYGIDSEALEMVAVPTLIQAMDEKKLIIIDEIGPMQASSEQFRSAVIGCLKSDAFVLGTICSDEYDWINSVKAMPNLIIMNLGEALSVYTFLDDVLNRVKSRGN